MICLICDDLKYCLDLQWYFWAITNSRFCSSNIFRKPKSIIYSDINNDASKNETLNLLCMWPKVILFCRRSLRPGGAEYFLRFLIYSASQVLRYFSGVGPDPNTHIVHWVVSGLHSLLCRWIKEEASVAGPPLTGPSHYGCAVTHKNIAAQ